MPRLSSRNSARFLRIASADPWYHPSRSVAVVCCAASTSTLRRREANQKQHITDQSNGCTHSTLHIRPARRAGRLLLLLQGSAPRRRRPHQECWSGEPNLPGG